MNILRMFARGLSAYTFRVSLFGLALSLGIVAAFGSATPIKSALDSSGIYDTPITKLANLKQQEPELGAEEQSVLPYDDPAVQNAIETALPSEKKKAIAENVLDGVFVWLNQEAEYPAFHVDLTNEKNVFIQTLADILYTRIESLPPCSVEELKALGLEFDPFNLSCKPPINLTAEKQKLIDEYSEEGRFLNDPTIDGEELFREGERRDSSNSAQNLPKLFGVMTATPIVFAIIATVALLGMLLLADSKMNGLHKIGTSLIGTAVTLLIVGIGLYFILGGIQASVGVQATPELQTAILSVFGELRWKFMLPGLILTVLYLVLGLIILAVTRKKLVDDSPDISENNPQAPTEQQNEALTPTASDVGDNDADAQK